MESVGLPEYERNPSVARTLPLAHAAMVVVAALAMGAPTIRGGFVGADDHRLVLNHVLVSQPSFAHTVELFTIPHRDLYQPLPLASFAFEFAVVRLLGMDARGAAGVAWLFHLDNVLLHAINALLVWLVIVRLQGLIRVGATTGNERCEALPESSGHRTDAFLAMVAALLFAVHPVQTEVVAWVNGRMMLLSTLFALLTVLSFVVIVSPGSSDGGKRSRINLAILCAVVFAVLCGLSKVRVGLPVLVLLPIVVARRFRDWRVMLPWIGVVVVTGGFALINIRTTVDANMFAGGTEMLHGPRLVRVLLALASYFQHILWPAGLASYYPAPPVVAWTDGATFRAMAIVAPVFAFWAWRMTRSGVARLGFVWFMATLASTLPFLPARNVLSADRYLYLPIIGLFWMLAVELVGLSRRIKLRGGGLRLVRLGGVAMLAIKVAVSWHVGSFYATAAAKTLRVAEVSPRTPRLWTRAGWAQYELGDYDLAAAYAQRDLVFEDIVAKSSAMELLGACALALGNEEGGYSKLRRAFEIDPENAKAIYRLGVAYAKAGEADLALASLETAVNAAPRYNPALVRLADIYRDAGRFQEARSLYGRALDTNAFDVAAIRGMVALDVRETLGTFDSLVERGKTAEAADLWKPLVRQWPESAEVQVWASWANALAGRANGAWRGTVPAQFVPLSVATRALVALQRRDYRTATAQVEQLSEVEAANRYAQRRLLGALQQHDQAHPGDAWTMCLAARLLLADGQQTAGQAFTGICEQQCQTEGCAEWVKRLRERYGQND